MERKLYAELASRIQARKACQGTNSEWFDKHSETITLLVDLLPHDCKIDLDQSHADKLVLYCSFQHMNDVGYWDGWTEHTLTVKPSLQFGFTLRVGGSNRNDIKEYLHQTVDYALRQDVRYNLYLPLFPELAVTSKWEDKDGAPSQCYQAWYSSDVRFWNDLDGAKKHAAELMEKKFFGRK